MRIVIYPVKIRNQKRFALYIPMDFTLSDGAKVTIPKGYIFNGDITCSADGLYWYLRDKKPDKAEPEYYRLTGKKHNWLWRVLN